MALPSSNPNASSERKIRIMKHMSLMKGRSRSGQFPLVAALLPLLSCASVATGKEPEIPLTAQGEKLLATYTEMLDSLKSEITAAAPTVDEQKKAAFLAAHAAVAKVPAPPNPGNLKVPPPRYADSNGPYREAQATALLAARAILTDVDAFLGSDQLHRKMVKCALLRHATPRGLAEFAQQGVEQEEIVAKLLADESLMKQIMEMGGAYEGKYGQAMQIYGAIQKASEHARDSRFPSRWGSGNAPNRSSST